MSKKLRNQAKYDQAVQALQALGITPEGLQIMTRATEMAKICAMPELVPKDPKLQDFLDLWDDAVYDFFEYELKEAWAMLEDV